MESLLEGSKQLKTYVLINELCEAEFSRDYDLTRKLFSPLWRMEEEPHFSDYEILTKAELYRLAGVFLINYGKAKNIPHFQSRGKDSLTKAKDHFWSIETAEKALEAQMFLAIAYYNEGSINEYQALLEDAESYFSENKDHPVYLLIQVNYLVIEISRGDLQPATVRINQISGLINSCNDRKIEILFFTQAGIVYRLMKNYNDAVFCLNKALDKAQMMKNYHYEALITNCLANTYRSMGMFDLALINVNKALEICCRDTGWISNFLDTKANIYYDKKDYETASEYAHDAVLLFRRGDDLKGLTEALWTQMRILFKLDLHELGFKTFFELHKIVNELTGESDADKYLNKFLEFIYFSGEGNFFEKVDLFKRFLIEKALLQSNGKIVEAATILGINHHQTLSAIINKSFPELLADFQIQRKKRSDHRKSKKFC